MWPQSPSRLAGLLDYFPFYFAEPCYFTAINLPDAVKALEEQGNARQKELSGDSLSHRPAGEEMNEF